MLDNNNKLYELEKFSFIDERSVKNILVDNTLGIRCVIPNNYFIWEATRPVTDCSMCENVTEVLNLQNCSREQFAKYAYTSKPLVIRNAASHWPAMKIFNFKFFKELFENIEGSYQSVEDECQFLTFKTEFISLKEVFNMSKKRVENGKGEKPWYVGWSVCHSEMLAKMREYYPRPHFFPEEAEHSHLDYIFMGYQQGAVMHLDYISRLMWQAQIIGRKTWKLVPPPECDNICNKMTVTVEPGDIVLLDTRQWYHDTTIEDGQFSLTVSSEYG
ncbi:conserved hypothetical protein [Pediculus humanus corporis]|uniref:Cupin-like domain-containing protein n=1 Tax=Pediculus humanus subsp. corporis TaxID=121224 RepID=E0VIT0_PEDHC|nr:uncharacterized protein Phum_PHUM232390 [Pediculus humanus corporis]EEB13286.1 conserved hypothetical protein [Pediculus humanus corporis]